MRARVEPADADYNAAGELGAAQGVHNVDTQVLTRRELEDLVAAICDDVVRRMNSPAGEASQPVGKPSARDQLGKGRPRNPEPAPASPLAIPNAWSTTFAAWWNCVTRPA